MATNGTGPQGPNITSNGNVGNIRLANINHNLLARIRFLEAENALLRAQHDRALHLAAADRQSRDQFRRDLYNQRQRQARLQPITGTVPIDIHERMRNQRDDLATNCDALRQERTELLARTRVAEEEREGMTVRLDQALHDLAQANLVATNAAGAVATSNAERDANAVERDEARDEAARQDQEMDDMIEHYHSVVMELRLQLMDRFGVMPREEWYEEE